MLLAARGSAAALSGGVAGQLVGNRELVDLNGDGIYDVGDGIVVNFSEPFTDSNDNGVYEPRSARRSRTSASTASPAPATSARATVSSTTIPTAPTSSPRTRRRGSPPRARPTSRPSASTWTSASRTSSGFARHYDNLVRTLREKGLTVGVQEGFGGGNCADLPDNDDQFRLVRYDAGHVGVAQVDPDDLFSGDVCGNDTVWERLLSLLGYLDKAFPDGFDGPGGDGGGLDIDLERLRFRRRLPRSPTSPARS